MNEQDFSYQDYLDRIHIQEVLLHAGYTFNRRDGLLYPSYVRFGSDGRRVHGDKFIVTNKGKNCFRPPVQKSYNLISLIKTFPHLFPEHAHAANPDHLVNEVCRHLLNIPNEKKKENMIEFRREMKPFSLHAYVIHAFRKFDFDSIKKFYPFFVTRGINIDTQKAFGAHFFLASKEFQSRGKSYTNLSFPLHIPGKTTIVGLEERGRPRIDGRSGYKGKAMGSHNAEGLWIAHLGKGELSEAQHVYWFESAYDAMSYYQLHVKENPLLNTAVFVSTGGNPTVGQLRGMLSQSPSALHHICFDNDLAGHQFTENLKRELHQLVRSHAKVTPELKPYLDSLPSTRDFTNGEIKLLPKPLQEKYAKYESVREKATSMRECGLSYEGDIANQEKEARRLYKEFRSDMRSFLCIDEKDDTSFVREIPPMGKDWNEMLLMEREGQQPENAEETEKVTSGIDLNGNGKMEVDESEEKKQIHKVRR